MKVLNLTTYTISSTFISFYIRHTNKKMLRILTIVLLVAWEWYDMDKVQRNKTKSLTRPIAVEKKNIFWSKIYDLKTFFLVLHLKCRIIPFICSFFFLSLSKYTSLFWWITQVSSLHITMENIRDNKILKYYVV